MIALQGNLEDFFATSTSFVHEGFSVSTRYLILRAIDGPMRLIGLLVNIGPLSIDESFSFSIETPLILAGQKNLNNQSVDKILKLLNEAAKGIFFVDNEKYSFRAAPITYSTELGDTNRWEYDAHLRAESSGYVVDEFDFASIDRLLRTAEIPFDGINDLTAWLGLSSPVVDGFLPSAEIRVRPPIDCIVSDTSLSRGELKIVLASHPNLDAANLSVALKIVPSKGLTGRRQIADLFKWEKINSSLNAGNAIIQLEDADSVLVIVSFAGKTIRRQWFIDPIKARNLRTFATRYFDSDLRQLRRALLETSDSAKFELAVCSLLFMLGFSAAPQLETDSPDLIATTPGGQMIILECTLKTADFQTKVGKLVDRRNGLKSQLGKEKHFTRLHAVLICRVPRTQIVYNEEQIKKLGVYLVTIDEIEDLLAKANYPVDPDSYFPIDKDGADGGELNAIA